MNRDRQFVIIAIFILVGLIYASRLFWLQVIEDKYIEKAEINATRKIIDFPARGNIFGKNNELLVINQPVFDLMVVMNEMRVKDTIRFCNAFGLTKVDFENIIKEIKSAPYYSRYKPVPFIKQLSIDDYARFNELLDEFLGFYVQVRTIRSYPHQSLANALGYIGEISKTKLERDTSAYYEQGDFIGISGLESYYESYLRGTKGVRYIMKDVRGVEKGPYKGGAQDIKSEPGYNLYTSLDLKLQQYAEKLMANKVGSLIAIEPKSGEILSFVSAPSYDPNILTGRLFSKNFDSLNRDPMKPLFNRPLMAMYPPGSIFKLAQALVAQQLGVIKSSTIFPCNPGAVGVNCHPHPSPQDLKGSIQWSCNPYYVSVFRNMMYKDRGVKSKYKETELNFDEWREMMLTFGFGQKLNIDITGVKRGLLPSNAYYDRYYGDLRWKHSTIRSLDIGQGELLIVPLQMVNLAAIVANKGYYITPHFVKQIGDGDQIIDMPELKKKNYVAVDSSYFQVVQDGMEMVVKHGTAYYTQIPGVNICGKTGTAQNPHGQDHSVFIAFAPKEDPKIAVVCYVENGGFGAVTAAPIVNLVIEKYLTDTTSAKTRWMRTSILEKDLISRYKNIYK